MDLKGLLNTEDKAAGQVKGEVQGAPTATYAPPYQTAQPSTPHNYGRTSQEQTPQYPPPSAGGMGARPLQGQGMTPLRTPSQTAPSAVYPLPHQMQQSPIGAALGQSYRPFESQGMPNLTARPGSHGQTQYPGQATLQHQNSYTSMSSTPPAHLSRTPSAIRQSPLATSSLLPGQQPPNTPLGPPQNYPQRAPTFPETHQQSPYRQRSLSNASHTLVSGSPAQHHPSIGNLVESPNAYARPSPRDPPSRQPSEYMSHSQRTSRERSISVSPKTRTHSQLPSQATSMSSGAPLATAQTPVKVETARASLENTIKTEAGAFNNSMPAKPEPPPTQHQMSQPKVNPPIHKQTTPTPQHRPSPAKMESAARPSLKRPASSSAGQRPAKKQRVRPIWAQLSRHNPKYHATNGLAATTNGDSSRPSKPRKGKDETEREPSFKNIRPVPGVEKAIGDFFFHQLAALKDVGTDPRYGTVEIEGKIGTIYNKDTNQRLSLPVLSETPLDPSISDQLRFESSMQEHEHAQMNQTLNAALRASRESRARQPMAYAHHLDIDSFLPLSPYGLDALPPAIRQRLRSRHQDLSLRTTTRHPKTGPPQVVARIVKVNVGNLQIFSPADRYDLRISVNVECNLDRPDLDPAQLTVPPGDNKPHEHKAERRKDRVSYTHLEYQIDLTRVDTTGSAESGEGGKRKVVYELEMEVETGRLRREMEVAASGGQSAFGDLVAGFWDNAALLMRERAG